VRTPILMGDNMYELMEADLAAEANEPLLNRLCDICDTFTFAAKAYDGKTVCKAAQCINGPRTIFKRDCTYK
jgi:hypothetical protein